MRKQPTILMEDQDEDLYDEWREREEVEMDQDLNEHEEAFLDSQWDN